VIKSKEEEMGDVCNTHGTEEKLIQHFDLKS